MKFMGDSVSEDVGHHQKLTAVNILDGAAFPVFPDEVFILATGKDATYFSGAVPKFGTFVIDGGGVKLSSNTVVTIWEADVNGDKTGSVLQKFEFHASCSQPLLTGDQFVSIKLQSLTLGPK